MATRLHNHGLALNDRLIEAIMGVTTEANIHTRHLGQKFHVLRETEMGDEDDKVNLLP